MLPKALLIAFSLSCTLLPGCIIPSKPVVTLCDIDYPDGFGICNQTALNFKFKTNELIKFNSTHIELPAMDKYTCFSPDDWKLELDYVHALEQYAQQHP